MCRTRITRTTHLVHLLEDLAEPRRQRIALLGEQGVARLSALETALGDGEVHPGRAGVDNARNQARRDDTESGSKRRRCVPETKKRCHGVQRVRRVK
jgi:hypothetical protein